VGRSPEPGRLDASPRGGSGRKQSWASVFSWTGPLVKKKKSFGFSFIIWEEKYFGKCLFTHLCSKNGEINCVVILMSTSMG
jgi:hypothetical protein